MLSIDRKSGRGRKIALLGGLLLVAIVIIGYFTFLRPPSGKDLAGTITPAQRYRADQIKKEDVKVTEDQVQKFLQTETFHRLLVDAKARKEFQALVSNPAFTAVMQDKNFQNIVTDKNFQNIVNDKNFSNVYY